MLHDSIFIMYIIPYIKHVKEVNKNKIYNINILCQAGRYIWEEDDAVNIKKEILADNNFIEKCINKHIINNKQIVFIELNMQIDSPEFNNMYKWDEIPYTDLETLCWRKYIWIVQEDGTPFLSPETDNLSDVPIQTLIEQIINY